MLSTRGRHVPSSFPDTVAGVRQKVKINVSKLPRKQKLVSKYKIKLKMSRKSNADHVEWDPRRVSHGFFPSIGIDWRFPLPNTVSGNSGPGLMERIFAAPIQCRHLSSLMKLQWGTFASIIGWAVFLSFLPYLQLGMRPDSTCRSHFEHSLSILTILECNLVCPVLPWSLVSISFRFNRDASLLR